MSEIRLNLKKVEAGAACLAEREAVIAVETRDHAKNNGVSPKDQMSRGRGLRNLVAVVICLAGITVFSGCNKDNNQNQWETSDFYFTITNNSDNTITLAKAGNQRVHIGDNYIQDIRKWMNVNIAPGNTSEVLGPIKVEARCGSGQFCVQVHMQFDDNVEIEVFYSAFDIVPPLTAIDVQRD